MRLCLDNITMGYTSFWLHMWRLLLSCGRHILPKMINILRMVGEALSPKYVETIPLKPENRQIDFHNNKRQLQRSEAEVVERTDTTDVKTSKLYLTGA